MPFPLLPKLSEDNNPISTNVSGQWQDAMGQAGMERFLQGLSDGIDVADDDRKIDSIDSIPDIWARPILFRMALFGSKGFDPSLHKKVKGEWRCLLAMLALKDVRHLALTAVHVPLAKSALGTTLSTFAPTDSASGDPGSWSDIYVISLNGAPLAITSPTTLVAAAADYGAAMGKGGFILPWSEDGKNLTDPLPHLLKDELSGLRLYLNTLRDSLSQKIPAKVQATNKTSSQLLGALDEYIKDVNSYVDGTLAAAGNLVNAGFSMHIGIFEFLDKTIQAPTPAGDGAGAASSAVRLITSGERNEPPLLLLSQKMLGDICVSRGLSAAQLVIWPGITAADIREGSLAGDRTAINGIPIEGATWQRPEEFFTDRLTTIDGGSAFKGVLKVAGSDMLSKEKLSVILPLKEKILSYFTAKEIAKRTRILNTASEINVEFTFPLSGINGKTIDYKVKKSYPTDDVILLQTDVPTIEIWPNFRRPGWERYYLYYENADAQNNASGTGLDFFYVAPWAYGRKISDSVPERGLSNRYTARLRGFPESLVVTLNRTAPNGVGEEAIEAGILLMAEPEAAPAAMGNLQIGVDFGTSSTMLYCKDDRQAPQPLNFSSNLFHITENTLTGLQMYRNFIPFQMVYQQEGSFLSIFQLLNEDYPKGANPVIRPLEDGNVFYLSTAEGPEAKDFRENRKNIDANLKWKGDQLTKLKVASYVKQICLQGLAQAAKDGAKSVSWNFSYPTAFSATQTMAFRNTCKNAVNEAVADTGFTLPGGALPQTEYWPESQASAYYFRKLGGVNFGGGAICLDIGAGTTDVSVISGTPAKIVYHTSLQFAGRYLFRSIYENYHLFAPSLLLDGMGDEQKNALIDADMRKNSADYLAALITRTDSGDVEIEKVLQRAQFAAAGIFYYIGGLIGVLHEKGIFSGESVPDIYVGGNGSRIFPWISGGVFDVKSPYITVFFDMLIEASGLKGKHVKMHLSPMPKVEVASGMVGDKPPGAGFFDAKAMTAALFGADGIDKLIADSVFAGDEFIDAKGENRPKTTFISAYDISAGLSVEDVGGLKAFTEAFNKNQYIWNKRMEISDETYADVVKALKGAYGDEVGRTPDDIFVEPVFILALKEMVRRV